VKQREVSNGELSIFDVMICLGALGMGKKGVGGGSIWTDKGGVKGKRSKEEVTVTRSSQRESVRKKADEGLNGRKGCNDFDQKGLTIKKKRRKTRRGVGGEKNMGCQPNEKVDAEEKGTPGDVAKEGGED